MKRAHIAENVKIVDEGRVMTAVWIADPKEAEDPLSALRGGYYWTDGLEVVAVAARHYRSEGARFSGWIVRHGANHTDPISGKSNALQQLKAFVREHFACGQEMLTFGGSVVHCTRPKGHGKAHSIQSDGSTVVEIYRSKLYPEVARPGPAWQWTYSYSVNGQPEVDYGTGLSSLRDMLRRKYGTRGVTAWEN